jgi:2-oxoglutarate dehydrogenase complex dehydrogenase (E1) component-like enzyme
MKADWRAHLEQEFESGQAYKPNKADWLDGVWSGMRWPTTRMSSAAARPPCR